MDGDMLDSADGDISSCSDTTANVNTAKSLDVIIEGKTLLPSGLSNIDSNEIQTQAGDT